MRNALLALTALTGLVLLGMGSAEAQTRPYRFCLVEGGMMNGPGTCYYNTYAQCMASASGLNAFCQLNPVYAFAEQYPPPVQPRKIKKKRHYHHHTY